MHILIVSKSNLKLQVFGLFSRFVRTLIIKISSSEEPANSTSIHRVRNGGKLVILFHPFPKNVSQKGVDRSVENRQKRAETIEMAPNAPNAPNKLSWRIRNRMPLCCPFLLIFNKLPRSVFSPPRQQREVVGWGGTGWLLCG